MRSIGLPEVLVLVGSLVGVAFYGIVFFILWKFYQVLSKINENIVGIKRALEHNVHPQ